MSECPRCETEIGRASSCGCGWKVQPSVQDVPRSLTKAVIDAHCDREHRKRNEEYRRQEWLIESVRAWRDGRGGVDKPRQWARNLADLYIAGEHLLDVQRSMMCGALKVKLAQLSEERKRYQERA